MPAAPFHLLARTCTVALLLVALGLLLAWPAAAQDEPAWDDADTTVVLSELEGPIDIAIEADGAIWWNEFYSGNVTRWDATEDETEVRFHADPVPDPVERGLLGLALDPEVASNGVFYVYYTVADPDDPAGGTNHLSRVEDGEETRLLEVSAHKRHNGGRITFDDEGRLFVSTGDNTEGDPAQDEASLLGKILHLHPNGTPADDTIEGPVHSIGHRNVYGLAYDGANDRLFATENNDRERDEINMIEAGENYGWPHCQGTIRYDFEQGQPTDEPCDDPRFRDPIGEFYDNYTAAPTGATVSDGDLYWAAWNEGAIHRMEQSNATGDWHDRVVYETDGRINDIEVHEGSLYFANWTAIVRLDGVLAGVEEPAPGGEARVSEEPDDGYLPTPDSQPAGPLLALATASLALAAGSRDRRGWR